VHDTQELQELDAPLLEPFDAELRQCRVGELLLDLQDELLDARGRRQRFLMLQAGERDLVFLIGEVEADATGNQQRAADERKDQQEVAAEKPPALNPRDFGVLLLDGLDGLQRPLPRPTLSLGKATQMWDCGGANPAPALKNLPARYGPYWPLSQRQASQTVAVWIGAWTAIVGSGRASETATAARRTKVGSSSATKSRCSVMPVSGGRLLRLNAAVLVMAPSCFMAGSLGATGVPRSELRLSNRVMNSPQAANVCRMSAP
jgi:hypothetical protein